MITRHDLLEATVEIVTQFGQRLPRMTRGEKHKL
jgi:hypothetical protein